MDELRKAFLDLLDGCKGPHEIMEQTGLPIERCQEIYQLFLRLLK